MGQDNLPLGRYGEELAVKYLQKHGYKIIERNFQKRYGEIDIIAIDYTSRRRSIIARDGETLVFVEVKTRIGEKYGPPEEAITPWKLKTLIRSAQFYKMLHPGLPDSLRIDVIACDLSPAREVKEIRHIKNITG